MRSSDMVDVSLGKHGSLRHEIWEATIAPMCTICVARASDGAKFAGRDVRPHPDNWYK